MSLSVSRTGQFIGKYTTPAELKEFYIIAEKASKPLALFNLIQANRWRNILCFVNTLVGTERLSILMRILSKGKLKVEKISSALHRRQRERILKQFSNGNIDMYVDFFKSRNHR